MEKLANEEFMKISTTELSQLFQLFNKYKYELRIAGGAVRDLLMHIVPKDIDLATNATPEQMKAMFANENIRTLNRNGEKHGTITVRLNDTENFEITTLRIDVKTDGRHAEVEFTEDWKLDANRRDLTINSMFLDEYGHVYDYFGGFDDLKERRVKFVGDSHRRIKEDYLRILRFFRFYGRISILENNFDECAIDAIKSNASGLQGVHGERIWQEMRKIITGNFAESILRKMIELNVNKYIGLPDRPNMQEFSVVCKRNSITTTEYNMSPVTLITALLYNNSELEIFAKRVKLSNEEKKLAEFLLMHRMCNNNEEQYQKDQLKVYKEILVDNVKDLKIYDKLHELLLYNGHWTLIKDLDAWTVPNFPLTGDRLIQYGLEKGPIFARILSDLRDIWKHEFNFDSDEETLLKRFETMRSVYIK